MKAPGSEATLDEFEAERADILSRLEKIPFEKELLDKYVGRECLTILTNTVQARAKKRKISVAEAAGSIDADDYAAVLTAAFKNASLPKERAKRDELSAFYKEYSDVLVKRYNHFTDVINLQRRADKLVDEEAELQARVPLPSLTPKVSPDPIPREEATGVGKAIVQTDITYDDQDRIQKLSVDGSTSFVKYDDDGRIVSIRKVAH